MMFVKPEEKIVVQGYRDMEGMYFVVDGSCRVHIEDKSRVAKK